MAALEETADYALNALKEKGFDRVEAVAVRTAKEEVSLEAGEIGLLRSVQETSLSLSGIVTHRRGSVTIGDVSRDSVNAAVDTVVHLAGSGEPDEAHDISPFQGSREFRKGADMPDTHLMLERLEDFRSHVFESFHGLILRRATMTFHSILKHYLNSNGTDLHSKTGHYTLSTVFASKEGSRTSSFNYTHVSASALDRPIQDFANLNVLMRQTTEQVNAREFDGKFTGSIILTPESLNDFLKNLCLFIGNPALIRGTSIFQGSLNRTVSDSSLSLRSMPVYDVLSEGCFITDDGFVAENTTLIEKGVLRSFLLNLYGSRKTGFPRAGSTGGFPVVDPGSSTLEEMVRSVDRGVMLCRFSGDDMSAGGDFSGLAKNSYYIEDGKILYPVKNVMVSGNLRDMLMDIRTVSSERTNMGFALLPWVLAEGARVSGGSCAD